MNLLKIIFALCCLCVASSSFALEGVFAGSQCYHMKFDFHADGRLFITEASGRESPAKYTVSGDKIAVDTSGDGPGFVLTLQDDTVRMKLPGVLGQPAHTVICTKPFNPAAYGDDPQLIGCWKGTKQTTYKDEHSAPKEKDASACWISFYDRSNVTNGCKIEGKPVSVFISKYGIRKQGVIVSEIVKADQSPQSVGNRHDVYYSISGDTLQTHFFPREINPDNASAAWKQEFVLKRATASECK